MSARIAAARAGVFVRAALKAGTVVERAHCITVPAHEYQQHVRHTIFEEYLFCGSNGDMLLALGLASLFNHSDKPCLDYRIDKAAKVITFTTARDVAAGEELTFYYGSRLWFEDKSAAGPPAGGAGPSHEHMDDGDEFLATIGDL